MIAIRCAILLSALIMWLSWVMNDLINVVKWILEDISTWGGYKVADILISLLVLLATICLFTAIFLQTRSQIKSVELQSKELDLYKKQLEYTKNDFERRDKIITFEVINGYLENARNPTQMNLIRNILEGKRPIDENFDYNVRSLLNQYEKLAISFTLTSDSLIFSTCG